MELKVKLETLLSCIEYYDDAELYGYYINVETGEGYDFTEGGMFDCYDGGEGEALFDEILDSDKYLMLPHWGHIDNPDNHEEITREFITKTTMDEKTEKKFMKILKKIKRRGGYDAFLAEIHPSGLDKEWAAYLEDYCEKYVRKWCAEHNITILEE